MDNVKKYNEVFTSIFHISEDQLPSLTYQSISMWDSVGHMVIIAGLEEAFDIMMDTEDIIDFSSYEKGKELLRKYNVNI